MNGGGRRTAAHLRRRPRACLLACRVLDAATTERTLLLAEIYRRRSGWRLRAVGQGYDDGLAELATRHGVVVDDG